MNALDGKRTLVTGGSGFIGRHLVPRLVEQGAAVTVLTRSPARTARVLPGVDLTSDVREAARRAPEIVINLAGAGIADRPWTSARRQELLQSRVGFTDALRSALDGLRPNVVVSASAVGIYGLSRDRRFTEADGVGEGFAAELCRAWEASAMAFEGPGTRVAIARIGLVLGPGGLLERMRLPFSLGLGGRIGDGGQWMSWVHLDDVCALLLRLARDPDATGPVNLTAPHPARNAEFTAALGRALGRPAFIPVPAFVLRAVLGEMAEELLLEGAAVLPQRALALGHEFAHADLDAAMRDALAR